MRVSVEYDMGPTNAAPKSVRLFVPYWIHNDSSVPLSYRIVEVDPLENLDADSQTTRAFKSTKFTLKHSSKSIDRKSSYSKRNSSVLEVIDDFSPNCVMLSPQDYISNSGASSSSSCTDGLLSTRVGISVAVHNSEHYSPGISLTDLERMVRRHLFLWSSPSHMSFSKLIIINILFCRSELMLKQFIQMDPISSSQHSLEYLLTEQRSVFLF